MRLRTAFGAPKTQVCAGTGTEKRLVALMGLGVTECAAMLAIKIIGWWVLLSFTLGPSLTWLFFYGQRQRKLAKDRHMPIDNPSSRRAVG